MKFNEHDILIKSKNKRASDTQEFLKLLASKSFTEQIMLASTRMVNLSMTDYAILINFEGTME